MPHLNPFAVSNILIVITFLPFLIFLLINSKTQVVFIFVLHTLVVILWGIGAFFIGINTDLNSAPFFWKFSYSPVLFMAPLFLHVVFSSIKKKFKLITFLIYLQAFVFLLITWTDKMFVGFKFMFNSFYYPQGSIFYLLSFVIWLLIAAIAFLILVVNYERSYPKERKQLLFLIVVVLIGFGGGAMNFLPGFGFNFYPYGNFLVPVYFFIIAYAVLRHQLLGIEITIGKSVVYSILLGLISVAYLVFVFILEKFLQGMVGYRSIILSGLVAFVLGIVFIPLRNRIQYIIDRIFFHGTQVEITQQNELLLQEVARTEKLKSIAILASGMAHEIKNPLTSLKTFSEFLPQKLKDEEFLLKFSKIVTHEVERINALVHDLLEFARPSAPQLEKTDICRLLENILDFLNNEFIKHNIKVIREFIPDLCLNIDPNQFRQVFLNLFMNAVDAMASGGIITVTVNLRQSAPKFAIICVKDTGCGIIPEDVSRIFDPFFTKKPSGIGLGLSIVHEIIASHKGTIKAKSQVGKGTSFTIELPISESTDNREQKLD